MLPFGAALHFLEVICMLHLKGSTVANRYLLAHMLMHISAFITRRTPELTKAISVYKFSALLEFYSERLQRWLRSGKYLARTENDYVN
jgi:hypothetical protein